MTSNDLAPNYHNVIEVSRTNMGRIPDYFTGITYTKGRYKPYALWLNGQIEKYIEKKGDAFQALHKTVKYNK